MILVYILAAILIFGVLIAVHEFGHFAAAKLCGVRVNEFSIGMGPLIWHKETGETQYSLRLLPIGGFCAMEGEDESSSDERALNRQGFLNGHTPFSALAAFSSLLAARMYGLSYIALSNESSANESTVAGSTVNHQYSKSFKFEMDFHRYRERYLPGSAYYFSLLRPLSEFQIAKYFAGQKQYHRVFRSCNAGSKTDSWCGRCPKCLFVYLILSPFLESREVEAIFGRNMLEDVSLRPTLEQLIGMQEEKPFECVGSRDEINTATVLAIDRMEREGKALPALLAFYKDSGMYEAYRAAGDPFSTYFDEENLLPGPLKELVRKACASLE